MVDPISAVGFVTPVVKATVTTYNARKTIATMIFKAVSLAVDSRVVVTGLPGAGKSYLFAALNQELRDKKMVRPGPSTKGEDEILYLGKGLIPKKVTIIPGQKMAASFSLMEKYIDKNQKLKGLIHVLDYGYNFPRDKYSHDHLEAKGITTFEKLHANNLKEELDYLENLIDRLIAVEVKPKWFCLVINKVDLFKSGDAINFYSNSARFIEILDKLYKIFPAENTALLIPVCCDLSTIRYGRRQFHPIHVKDHTEVSAMLHGLLNKIMHIDG